MGRSNTIFRSCSKKCASEIVCRRLSQRAIRRPDEPAAVACSSARALASPNCAASLCNGLHPRTKRLGSQSQLCLLPASPHPHGTASEVSVVTGARQTWLQGQARVASFHAICLLERLCCQRNVAARL